MQLKKTEAKDMTQLKCIYLIALISLLYFHSNEVMASNYYLSEKGNDSNIGIQISPWRTLEKLSLQMKLLKPGDSILFERGSTFYGTLEIASSGIYAGTYGSGAKPVIRGSIAIKQWKYFKDNIWVAPCPECDSRPGNLFINGVAQLLGRYPNNSFLTISGECQSQTELCDTTLRLADGYWNKAEVVVRSSRWTFDNLIVNQYKDNRFSFATPASYPLLNGFGYFIQNHPSTLDQHGEWYFDSSAKTIYVYLNPGRKPSQHVIEASVCDVGLTADGIKNVTIENLTLADSRIAGLIVQHSSAIKLNGVDIVNSGKNGMEIRSCKDIQVQNSCITDSNNNGVQWHNNTNSLFTQNQICRTGLQPGRGESGNGTYLALYITSDATQLGDNVFQYNTIDSVGYSAIDFRTANTKIKDNIISNFCLIKDDGAGIYTWGNVQKGNVVEGNRISNGIGSGKGSVSPMQQLAHGIYIDDRSSDVTIKDNVISYCSGSGIFLHNAKSISVLNNRVYSNGRNISNNENGELYIRIDTLGQFGRHLDMQLIIEGNTWMADETSHGIYLSVERESDLYKLGVLTNNYFRAAFDEQTIAVMVRQSGACRAKQLSLEEWQLATRYEDKSIFKSARANTYLNTIGNDLITNGAMTKNVNGWIVWPEKLKIRHETISILDGPSLKIHIPVGNSEALLYQEGISLSKGKMYRLSFSAISPEASQVEFVPLMATEPWQALGAYTCFTIGSARKTFTYYFIVEKSSTKARVNFKSKANFWIDSVSLHEMELNY
jgi:parallel beta-helix repeat protein